MIASTLFRHAPRIAAIAIALAAATLAGCGREAGSQIKTADFGSATMNNHLVQSCEVGTLSTDGKYGAPSAGCPGRTLDGRYAQVIYDGYVADAVPVPQVTTGFQN